MIIQTFNTKLCFYIVSPQELSITKVPQNINENQMIQIQCIAGRVKPVDGLNIELMNGTASVAGTKAKFSSNLDGYTQRAVRSFNFTESRYGDRCHYNA